MPCAVDDARSGDWNPNQLDAPHAEAEHAEQRDVNEKRYSHALPGIACVNVTLDPVVRRAVAIALHGVSVLRFIAIHVDAEAQHVPMTMNYRTVRIIDRFTFRVMFAMDRDPFLSDHAGRKPKPSTEKVRDDGVKIERAMRLGSMQKDGDGGDGDVSASKCHQHQTPPRQVESSALRERQYRLENRIKQSVLPVYMWHDSRCV